MIADIISCAIWFCSGLMVHSAWAARSKAKPAPMPFNHNPRTNGVLPQAPPWPMPQKPQSRWEWRAMPGGSLELGPTGFYITLNPSEPSKVYQAFTPEHFRIAYGLDLAGLKRMMEIEAIERAEFDPPEGGWVS